MTAQNGRALLMHFAAEAHRRKWRYDRGLDGDGVPIKSKAFDALHRLGDEMNAALHKLDAAAVAEAPTATDSEATTCSARHATLDDGRPCIRAAHHTGVPHTDYQGFHWSDTVAVYPLADSTVKVGPSAPRPAEEIEDERAVREHHAARRAALRAFVEGVRLGVSFSNEEEQTFAAHLETEFREADAARAEAKRQEAMGLSGMRAVKKLLERRMTTLRTRAEQAEELLRIAHETSNRSEAERAQAEKRLTRIRDMADAWERRLPATIRTATAAEAVRLAAAGDYRPVMFGMQSDAGLRAELEQAQAAIERVREFKQWLRSNHPSLTAVRARLSDVLDGAEQPATETEA